MGRKIFVSYRRDDSAASALGISQALARAFGSRNVFLDVDMRSGINFPTMLERHLAQCKVLIALIGPNWLNARDDQGRRRLDNPLDWVRLEISRALQRGVPVIPVCVSGAQLPDKAALPDDLKGLVDHMAAFVSNNTFRNDIAGLIRDIKDIPGGWNQLLIAAVAIALLAGVAPIAYEWNSMWSNFWRPKNEVVQNGPIAKTTARAPDTISPDVAGKSHSGSAPGQTVNDNAKVQRESIRMTQQILRDQGLLPITHDSILSFRDRPPGGQPCAGCPELVVAPRGSFLMGSDQGKSDEVPAHGVAFLKSFAVGKYLVTRGEFAAFVNDTGYKTEGGCAILNNDNAEVRSQGKWEKQPDRSWRSPGFDQDDHHPVVCTSGDDASAFVTWLSRKTSNHYRLLTEAEWEYVARAGSTTTYFFGDDPDLLCNYGNGADLTGAEKFTNWSPANCRDHYVFTSPVGIFRPNDWGLYDVIGNARERMQDCYNASYRGAPNDGSAWVTGSCDKQVLRGGSWNSDPSELRSASRDQGAPSSWRYDNYGFRVARDVAQ